MNSTLRYIFAFFFIPAAISIWSCSGNISTDDGSGDNCRELNHAVGFCIEDREGYRKLTVYNPWQGARNRVFSWYLVTRNDPLPPGIRESRVIRTPVERIVCLSTTHIALIDQLGETSSISAVSNSKLVNNTLLRRRIEEGKLPDIGYEQNLDFEKILSLQPCLVTAYGVGSEASGYVQRLEELGINVVIIGEYLEPTPLAQAEWIKFMAAFFNLDELAEEKFSKTEKKYNEVASLISAVEDKPVVMAGLPWRNSWFVPGGRSFFATMVEDAGGNYIWKNNSSRENFPIDMEKMFEAGDSADIWLNTGSAKSTDEILNVDTRLSTLPPFRNGRIYNNTARLNEYGGNDFWERGITEPHIILRDLAYIFHPSLLPGHEHVYYEKIGER